LATQRKISSNQNRLGGKQSSSIFQIFHNNRHAKSVTHFGRVDHDGGRDAINGSSLKWMRKRQRRTLAQLEDFFEVSTDLEKQMRTMAHCQESPSPHAQALTKTRKNQILSNTNKQP
jgi:hypothetical protein